MEKERVYLVNLCLDGCPAELRPILHKLTVDFWHEQGIEPNILTNDDNQLTVEIKSGDREKEEMDRLGAEWGKTLTDKVQDITDGENSGMYWKENIDDFNARQGEEGKKELDLRRVDFVLAKMREVSKDPKHVWFLEGLEARWKTEIEAGRSFEETGKEIIEAFDRKIKEEEEQDD